MWMVAVVAYFKVLSWHTPEGMRNATKNLSQKSGCWPGSEAGTSRI
jgi:hypothetical protein